MNLFKFELPTLYARAKSGAVLTWDIEIEGNKFRTITGQEGGSKVTSAWTVCTGKNTGKANSTTDDDQAQAEADAKWKKKIKTGGYWEDVKDIDKQMAFIEPMLAYPLISKKTKKVKNKKTGEIKEETVIVDRTPLVKLPVMVDRKYNGMRQVASVVGPYSRKGEQIKTAPHIYDALTPLFELIPSLVIDGELYNHEYRHKLNELISIVRKTSDKEITPKLLSKSELIVRYYVYDGYGFDCPEDISIKFPNGDVLTMDAGTPVEESTPNILRREALKSLLKNIPYIVVVPYYLVSTMAEATSLYGGFIEDGYEGAILRNPNAGYQHDRTNDLIKLKPYEDMEVIILEIIDPMSGNWGGTAKTASVRMDNGKVFTATFKGGKETLAKILKEQDTWIGQKVTITYNGWTGLGTPNYAQIDPNNCAVGDR